MSLPVSYAHPHASPAGTWRINQRGFTLLELIASLVLLGLLAAIFGMGLVAALQSHEFSRANVRLAQKAQPAMARMARELKELTHIEAWSTAGPHPYILYHRMPGDNHAAVERFGLHFDSTDRVLLLYTDFKDNPPLNASTKEKGDILVDGVKDLTLKYRTAKGDWDGSDIRYLSTIEIFLELLRPEGTGAAKVFQTTVHLRNTRNAGGADPTVRPASQDQYNCLINTIHGGR